MKLIIGLGNPEAKFAHTRHNAGFAVLDMFAEKHSAAFNLKDKFHAHIAEIVSGKDKVLLAKPTTYYNLVGESARSICDFYKISAEDVLVVHDELALPFGTIRTRLGGSDAGNNGVKSINQHLGGDTARLRFGIYNSLRDQIDDADFVLATWTKQESDALPTLFDKAGEYVDDFVAGTFKPTSHSA